MNVQLAHWIDVITGRAEPVVRVDEVRAALAAGLAGQESLDSGRAVDVAPSPLVVTL